MAESAHGFCFRCATALELKVRFDKERPVCPACGYIVFEDPKVAVAVLVHRGRELLLGRRNINPGKGSWSFTSGYVDRGEVLEVAAVREVREELGLTVALETIVGAYSEPGDPVVLIVYPATVEEGDPTPDGHEVVEAGWFPVEHLPEMAFEHDQHIVSDWLRSLDSADGESIA